MKSVVAGTWLNPYTLFPRSRVSSTIPMVFIALAIGFASDGQAEDWPHWRGPDRNDQSTETGLLQEWPEDGPQKIWVNQDAGLGYAGFSVVGGKLFTMGLENEEEFGLCLNAETGEELWRKPLGTRYENRWGDGPRSTPSIDGSRCYFMAANGDLVCLKTEDGADVWRASMKDFGGKVPQWGYSESPLVDGDKVVCTPGGKQGTILALNKMTGEKVWQSEPVTKSLDGGRASSPAPAHYSSIVPVDWGGNRQYIQLTVLAIVGISAEDGSKLWQSDWSGRTAVIPSPIVFDDNVYVTSGYSVGSKLVKIGQDNAVQEVWFSKDMQNHHGGVIKVGDFIYGSSAKSFVCQSVETGKRTWSEREIKKGAVVYADNRLYHIEERSGKVLLLEVNGSGAKVKGQFTLSPQTERRKPSGRIWVHPVVSDGKLYLRDQEIIHCYDIKTK